MSNAAQENAKRRNKAFNLKFVGKTIERVEADTVNVVTFYFTDGKQVKLNVEAVLPTMGLYGIAVH